MRRGLGQPRSGSLPPPPSWECLAEETTGKGHGGAGASKLEVTGGEGQVLVLGGLRPGSCLVWHRLHLGAGRR
jgi:hypothetical protein